MTELAKTNLPNETLLPGSIVPEISSLAEKYDVERVILFGSRARGDQRERSDIDLAVVGGDVLRFSSDINEVVRTLLIFDVVNLGGPVSDELRREIQRDGKVIYEKTDNFNQTLANLRDDGTKPVNLDSPREVAGRVALFTICLEQAWKNMKMVLEYHGYPESQTGSPRAIIKLAYQAQLINNEEGWLQMLDDRNHANHTYNEEQAQAIIDRIGQYHLPLLEKLHAQLQSEEWKV